MLNKKFVFHFFLLRRLWKTLKSKKVFSKMKKGLLLIKVKILVIIFYWYQLVGFRKDVRDWAWLNNAEIETDKEKHIK